MTYLEIDFPSRVTVALQAGESSAAFDFIWGIGLNGLTDFELALSRKAQGETVQLSVQPENLHSMFEHLAGQVIGQMPLDGPVSVAARIQKIEKADSREVVKAMAGLQEGGCGCGGGGDCGCH